MQQRERTSQQISETEEWTITYGHGQLQSKRKRSQFERQTSWAPIIPQPSASGRVSRSFLDTWSWMLLHSQWFWREKNINVNRSHPVQSYFSKPSKQANMKLSLPDISTWLLPHPMSSVGIVSTWGGGTEPRSKDAFTSLPLLSFSQITLFWCLLAEDNIWPLMTRATFTNFVLPSPSQRVFASWGLSAASLLFSISFAFSLITSCPVHCQDVPADHWLSPSLGPGPTLQNTGALWYGFLLAKHLCSHPISRGPRFKVFWVAFLPAGRRGQRSRRDGIQETRALV